MDSNRSEAFTLHNAFPGLSMHVHAGSEWRMQLVKIYTFSAPDRQTIRPIEDRLSLSFLEDHRPGNVCFASNNEELRDEYKQVFSGLEFCDYVVGQLLVWSTDRQIEVDALLQAPIPYPADAGQFWESVRSGAAFRLSSLSL